MELFKLMGTIAVNNSEANSAIAETTGKAEASESKISSAFKKIGVAVITYFSVSKIKEFGQACINAWDVQKEAETKLETVMKQRMNATDESIQSIKELTSAQQKLGVVGDEVQLSGAQQLSTFLSTDSALKTLIPAMNNLAVQQNGVNVSAEAMTSIGNMMGKVMQGQTSALTRCGITMTDYQEQVMKAGTEEERAAMLAEIITDNVGDMNEVFAQTDAGKIQQAKNNFGDLQEQIGSKLEPVVASLYSKFNDLVVFLQGKVDPAFDTLAAWGDTIKAKYEEYLQPAVESLKGAFGDLAAAFEPVFDYFDQFVDSMTDDSGQAGLLNEAMSGLGEAIQIVAGAVSDLSDFFNDGFLEDAVETMSGISNDMIEIFSPLLGKFEEIKTTFLENIGQIKEPVTTLFSDIMGSASDIWESVGKPIYEAIEFAIEWVLDRFNEALPTIITIVSDTFSLLSDLWNNVLKPVFDDIGIVIQCLQPIFEVIFGVLGSIFGTLVDTIGNLWNNSLKPIFSGIIDFLSGIFTGDFSKAIDGLVGIFKGLWSGIKTIVGAIFDIIKTVFGGIWDLLKTIFGGIFDTISGVFSKIFGTISSVINTIASTISSVFGGIFDTISSIFTAISDTISSIWNGIWDTIKGVINSILGGIEGMVNGVIKGINKILGGIDTIVGGVGDLIGLDWSVPTLNEITLPRLAKGTVVDKPTIAQIGEDGTEAVVPLEKNREWITKVSEEMQVQGIGGDKETLSVLKEILALLKDDYSNLPDILLDAMVNGLRFKVNNREFARLVKAVN